MTTITPADIRQGDTFRGLSGATEWTALGNAVTRNLQDGRTVIQVEVQYADGGIDYRWWDTETTVRFTATATATDTGRTVSPIL